MAVRTFPSFVGIDWNPCGSLHLMCEDKKENRFPQTLKNWGWECEHMSILDADEASDVAGVELMHSALYIPDAGAVSPKKLCEFYARGVEVHLNHPTYGMSELDADVKVLACGYGARKFYDWLPLNQVRGQVTDVRSTVYSKRLKSNICYGGYITPVNDIGHHLLGATFQRWLNHSEPMVEDNEQNLEKLAAIAPRLAEGLKVVGHRAAVRTATQDHFPIVGRISQQDHVYVSVGHGSHGIVSTLMASYLLTDMILKRPYSLARDTVAALAPERFL